MKERDYYNCVFPEKRPRNIWVVYDTEGKRIGEVAANSEIEARQTGSPACYDTFQTFTTLRSKNENLQSKPTETK